MYDIAPDSTQGGVGGSEPVTRRSVSDLGVRLRWR